MAQITAIETRATGEHAKGIFPPLMRAMAHAGYMACLLQAELNPDEGQTARPTTKEELLGEVDEIAAHWTLIARPSYLGTDAIAALQTLSNDISTLRDSANADDHKTVMRNTQTFIKNAVSVGVLVDNGTYGLRPGTDTDAGTKL